MLNTCRPLINALLLATVVVPSLAYAQTTAQSAPGPFEGLQRVLKPGQTAEVTDSGGRTIVG